MKGSYATACNSILKVFSLLKLFKKLSWSICALNIHKPIQKGIFKLLWWYLRVEHSIGLPSLPKEYFLPLMWALTKMFPTLHFINSSTTCHLTVNKCKLIFQLSMAFAHGWLSQIGGTVRKWFQRKSERKHERTWAILQFFSSHQCDEDSFCPDRSTLKEQLGWARSWSLSPSREVFTREFHVRYETYSQRHCKNAFEGYMFPWIR